MSDLLHVTPGPRGNRDWWDDDCQEHDWIHDGDDLVCSRCGAGQRTRDPIVAAILFGCTSALIVGVAIAVFVWCRGGSA